MGDLVNRLRGLYSVGPDNTYGTRSFADFIPPIALEAANRIEELECALLLVTRANDSWGMNMSEKDADAIEHFIKIIQGAEA